MSTIRKQSIISSVVVYAGFALGALNIYLFTRQGSGFSEGQFGLTTVFVAAAQLMFSVANLGMVAYITKFFPYYKAHVPKENDLLTIALLVPVVGFLIVAVLGIFFENVVAKIFSNAAELPKYYYWLFPFAFGYTVFMVLDAYAWQLHKAVLSNFLKEVMFRAFTTTLIVLTTVHLITDFDTFISFYSFLYIALALFVLVYLGRQGYIHFSFQRSIVTKKFRKKILALIGFVWTGGLIFSAASVIDILFVAAMLPNGIVAAGVFSFGQYLTSLVQAPQRAVISASTGPLSQAWREKDYGRIQRIYQRSSINQLLFSCAMFALVWLNFEDGILTFHLKSAFTGAKWVFFILGVTRILDMGTGVNAQIISTSNYWRFEFITGLLLLALMMPLNFFLTRAYALEGPAIANLISFVIYNGIRYTFLLQKFGMQPFNYKTALTLLVTLACFAPAYFLFRNVSGLQWLVLRSLTFLLPFVLLTLWWELTPDVLPVWQTIKKRLRLAGA